MTGKWVADEVQLSSPKELLNTLSPRNDRWQPNPTAWIYRGVSDLRNHKLLATAHRPRAFEGFSVLRSEQIDFDPSAKDAWNTIVRCEGMLLREFWYKLDEVGLDLPKGLTRPSVASWGKDPQPELWPLWALARHHRLPCGLLDWTRRPFAAAYFAAVGVAREKSNPESRPGRIGVWALRRPMRPKNPGELDIIGSLQFYQAPNSTNPNQYAQSGLFTFLSADPIRPVNEYIEQLADEYFGNLDPPIMRLFSLPQECAPELLKLLSDEGVHGASLFPGYDGVVRYMRE